METGGDWEVLYTTFSPELPLMPNSFLLFCTHTVLVGVRSLLVAALGRGAADPGADRPDPALRKIISPAHELRYERRRYGICGIYGMCHRLSEKWCRSDFGLLRWIN